MLIKNSIYTLPLFEHTSLSCEKDYNYILYSMANVCFLYIDEIYTYTSTVVYGLQMVRCP